MTLVEQELIRSYENQTQFNFLLDYFLPPIVISFSVISTEAHKLCSIHSRRTEVSLSFTEGVCSRCNKVVRADYKSSSPTEVIVGMFMHDLGT